MEPCVVVGSSSSPVAGPRRKVSGRSSRAHPFKQQRAASSSGCRASRLDVGRDEGPPPRASPPLPAPALVGGKYLLQGQVEGSSLYRCVHVASRQEYIAKVLSAEAGRAMLSAHLRMRGHPHVAPVREALRAADGRVLCLLLPAAPFGHLHSHVRARRRLSESEARRLFRQMAAAVRDCHRRGLVLRDLKLRKFVFTDAQRTLLRLESLEDAVVLSDVVEDDDEGEAAFAEYSPAFPSSYSGADQPHPADDHLEEKRGCPAYVPPEVLCSSQRYSGRAADMWSLGVVLYTMLVGRYPFNGGEHSTLFARICRARFGLPEGLSPRARCLVRALLRREPSERPSAADVLLHPWLSPCLAGRARDEDCDPDEAPADDVRAVRSPRARAAPGDQAVPEADSP